MSSFGENLRNQIHKSRNFILEKNHFDDLYSFYVHFFSIDFWDLIRIKGKYA